LRLRERLAEVQQVSQEAGNEQPQGLKFKMEPQSRINFVRKIRTMEFVLGHFQKSRRNLVKKLRHLSTTRGASVNFFLIF
jgi:protein-arginine kinase